MRKTLLHSHFWNALVPHFLALLCLYGNAAAAADRAPEYLQSFDPAKGFKPAQRDLTEIFLQIAGSLEAYGSPEPYLRHVSVEHARIEGLYRTKYGTEPTSHRPAHMTDEYIDRLSANWKLLSPKLGLEPYAKDFGNTLRDAINGTRGTGTTLVQIFNDHQARVFDALSGKESQTADFESLKTQISSRLELDKHIVNDAGYEVARRDAVRSAIIIQGMTTKLFARLDHGLQAAEAERVKKVLTSIIMDVGQMAESELRAGISEWAISRSSTTTKSRTTIRR